METQTNKTKWQIEREEKLAREQVRWEKGAKVLELLGFTVLPLDGPHDAQSYEHGPVGLRDDGLRIMIHTAESYSNKGRFEVTHSLTSEEWKQRSYDDNRLEITLSPDKSPEQLAKDIKRRLIPEAEAGHAKIQQRLTDHHTYVNNRDVTYKRIIESMGCNPTEWDRERYQATAKLRGEHRCEIVVNGPDSVQIELKYLSADAAFRVLELLRGLQ